MSNIAIVIGHHKNAKGAFSKHLNFYEYDFYKEVVKNLQDVKVFEHDSKIKGYTERIKATAKKLNKENFDLVIELHFNSAVPQANGVETLFYFKSVKGKYYSELFSDVVFNKTGIKKRGNNGIKPLINKYDRGFASVFYPNAPTILIEPFFGSNKNDCNKIEGPKKMAEILKGFICQV